MTQAPATPELVERLRSYYPPICQEAADALEAQQARIAELEVERDDLQRMYRHWAMIADQRLGASNRSLHRARDLQALADRYEKALREISDLADECVVFDAENVAAVEAAPDKAAASPGFSVLRYWNERLKLSKSWKRRIDEIRDQALSSQGRHEGVTSGFIPELPGVNAVPLPASPDGPLSDGWLDISTAPKDGTAIQARIPGHGEDNVIEWISDALDDGQGSCGAWTFSHEDQEPPPCWSDGWCWAVNEDGLRSAWPTAWKPLPSPDNTNPKAGAPEHG